MKHTFLYIIIIISNFIFSQTYIATYKTTPITESIQLKQDLSEVYTVLIFSDNKSVYSRLSSNSVNSFNIEIPKIIYKDFNENIKITQTSFFGEGVNIKEEVTKFNWIDSNQSKQINKIKCTLYQMQIINVWNKIQQIYACVDKSIPVLDGPEDYIGLPGLIVELILPDKKIELTEVKILKKNSLLKEPVNSFKTLSKNQYELWVDDNLENMMNDMNKREGIMITP